MPFSESGMIWLSASPSKVGSSWIDSRMIRSDSWICSSLITSGGARRMIFSCVGLACVATLANPVNFYARYTQRINWTHQ